MHEILNLWTLITNYCWCVHNSHLFNTFKKMLNLQKTNSIPQLWKLKVRWISRCLWPSQMLWTSLNWNGETILWIDIKRIWTVSKKTGKSLAYSASRRSALFRWYMATSDWQNAGCNQKLFFTFASLLPPSAVQSCYLTCVEH